MASHWLSQARPPPIFFFSLCLDDMILFVLLAVSPGLQTCMTVAPFPSVFTERPKTGHAW